MKATRRAILAGGLAVPAVTGMAAWRWQHGSASVLLYDPDLAEGRKLAQSAQAWKKQARAITGDRIRFAREIFAARPAMVTGISRQADLVLIEDVASEMGYERAAFHAEGATLNWTFAPRV